MPSGLKRFQLIRRTIAALLVLLVALDVVSGQAQTEPVPPVIRSCSDRDTEMKLRVFRLPEFDVIAWDRRNTTNTSCMFGNYELRPNEVAHASRRWRTLAEDGTNNGCRRNDYNPLVGTGVLISSTLLEQLCSPMQESNYAPGPFVPDWPALNKAPLPPAPSLRLSSPKSKYMYGEFVPLHLSVIGFSAAPPLTTQGCPVFLRDLASSSSSPRSHLNRLEEMSPFTWPDSRFLTAMDCSGAQGSKDEPTEFDFDVTQYLDQKGPNTIRLVMIAGTSPLGEVRFIYSNSITIDLDDPAKIPQNWGPVQQGVHVALSLDKLTYAVGEDIPLHIAAQVVSSERPVYGVPDLMDQGGFAAAFHLTILGDDGVPVGNEDSSNLEERWLMRGGPIFCPSPLSPGKVSFLERSAKRLGLLPTQPGTYRMFVTWSPFPASDPACNQSVTSTNKRTLRPLVTAASVPVTIQITGMALTERGVPDIPIYDGWRRHFRVVDTPLGEGTALEDLRSHLQWLRLTLTKEQSIDSLRAQMDSGGRLAGWRFATLSEVVTFFANLTGSADGRSSDPGIERALQHLLGGPLQTSRNPDTGWSRRETDAVIAESRPATLEETPSNPARVPGTPPPCAGCGVGFMIWSADIREDTINGQIDAAVRPPQEGWSADVFRGPILVVRDSH